MQTIPKLPPEQLERRYRLLCQALNPAASHVTTIPAELENLGRLISQQLLDLARRGSPDHFADLYLAFEREIERFREFCAFPALAQRVVVGFGGAFSAGKSSLINALLNERLLVVEVDPTTSLPTYLLQGGDDEIWALNLYRQKIALEMDEFRSLTHDEINLYGCAVGRLLHAAFVTRRDFPWVNLALIDTPGYSKPNDENWSERTDENLARAQLNSSQAIVWVISAKAGGVTEDDVAFLASLRTEIPKLIVVSRADSVPGDDLGNILGGIRRTLALRKLPVIDVIPISSKKTDKFPLTSLRAQLDLWNKETHELRFAYNFKRLFTHYARGIEAELHDIHWQQNRLNRILVQVDEGEVRDDAEELKAANITRIERLKRQMQDLAALRSHFFNGLKRIGDQVGIPLPEPAEIDLLADDPDRLLDLLIAYRDESGETEPEYRQVLRPMMQLGEVAHCSGLLCAIAGLDEGFSEIKQPLKIGQSLDAGTEALSTLDAGVRGPHTAAGFDEHVRTYYALLLCTLLNAKVLSSDLPGRFLDFLLVTLGLNGSQEPLFENARRLTPVDLRECRRVIIENGLARSLFLDGIILIRMNGAFSAEESQKFTELAAYLSFDADALSEVVDIGLHILEIKLLSSVFFTDEQASKALHYANWVPHVFRRYNLDTFMQQMPEYYKRRAIYWNMKYACQPDILNKSKAYAYFKEYLEVDFVRAVMDIDYNYSKLDDLLADIRRKLWARFTMDGVGSDLWYVYFIRKQLLDSDSMRRDTHNPTTGQKLT